MKKLLFLILLIFLVSMFLVTDIRADLGPKPEINVLVQYNGRPIQDSIYGVMLGCSGGDSGAMGGNNFQLACRLYTKEECEKEFCEWRTYLVRDNSGTHNESRCETRLTSVLDSRNDCWKPAYFAWGGCGKGTCTFSYSPPENFKLAIYYPKIDKLFITDQASRTNFYSNFEVNLNPDGTSSIRETTSILQTPAILSFILAFILTFIIELFFGAIYISVKKLKPKRLISCIILANVISLSIVWFLFPLLTQNLISAILIGEIFAVFFEAFIFYWLDKKDFSSYRKAVELSVILNGTSFLLGGFIFAFAVFFFGLPLLL